MCRSYRNSPTSNIHFSIDSHIAYILKLNRFHHLKSTSEARNYWLSISEKSNLYQEQDARIIYTVAIY